MCLSSLISFDRERRNRKACFVTLHLPQGSSVACSRRAPQTKTAGSFDPAIQNSQPLAQSGANPQPALAAFFSNATFGIFFSICFFSSSAFGDNSAALALIRNASRPPR